MHVFEWDGRLKTGELRCPETNKNLLDAGLCFDVAIKGELPMLRVEISGPQNVTHESDRTDVE